MHRSLRVGLFLETLNDRCESDICEGVIDTYEGKDVELFIFEGAFYCSYLGFDYQYDLIKETIGKYNLDGLIIGSSFMLERYNEEELKHFLADLSDIGIVSLSLPVPNSSVITIDVKKGLIDLIDHLDQEHNVKNYAVITGPEYHYETIENLETIKNSLKLKGIDLCQEQILSTKVLTEPEGYYAGEELLNRVEKLPDAVICFDDYLAIGVIEYFKSRSIRVPDDVLVTGIDDIQEADTFHIPLTTIKQPFYKMGRRAAELIIDNRIKKLGNRSVVLDGHLVLRKSCGCFTDTIKKSSNEIRDIKELLFNVNYIPEDESELFLSFISNFRNEPPNNHTKLIKEYIDRENNPIWLVQKLRKILKHLLSYTTLSKTLCIQFQKILILLDEYLLNYEFSENSKHISSNWKYNFGTQLLFNTNSIEDLIQKLVVIIPELGTVLFFLYLFNEKAEKGHTPDMCHLKLAYNRGMSVKHRYNEIESTDNVFGLSLDPGINQIFLPLLSQGEYLGFIITEYKPGTSYNNYRALRVNIGTAINNALIFEKKQRVFTKKLDMFNTVSHEVKTPLTLCLNSFEKYKRSHPSLINNRDIQAMEHSLKRVISDIKNYMSGEDSDNFYYNHNQKTDLSEALKLKLIQFSETSIRKSINIESDIEENLLTLIDPNALDQVLNNLLENSIKYSRDGSKIFISIKKCGVKIELTLKDWGIGIKKMNLDSVFRPYFREEREIAEGHGLGLNIVKKIVDETGSSIDIDSREGSGTTVKIEFNLIKDDFVKPTDLNTNLENVLIIEEDDQLRYFLIESLGKRFKVTTAKNGREALDIINKNYIPDLIISDVVMKTMDGFGFIEVLNKKSLDIPVIFLSGKSKERDRMKALRKGVIYYIEKPFIIDELIIKVENILSLGRKKRSILLNEFEKSLHQTLNQFKKRDESSSIEKRVLELKDDYKLTDRDLDLIKYLCQNFSHKEIALRMDLQNSTIRNLSHKIYSKFHVSNKKELKKIIYANRPLFINS